MTRGEIMPLLSIVVPVYGTEQYLDRCIRSLQDQSYKNLEIIIVNDGSPGNVREIVQPYLKDKRTFFVDNEKNMGLLRARVCGARRARGEFIAFVDSDDYVTHDFYRVLISRAVEADADICIGKTVWEDNGYRYVYNYHDSCFHFDQLTGKEVQEAFFMQEMQCYSWHTIWNKVYKKSLWDKCMPEYETVDEHIIMTEDIFFSSILFYHAQSVVHADTEAYFYCSNENASTNSTGIKIGKFQKNMNDISFVFKKVTQYLIDHGAEQHIIDAFKKGKSHYGRMWKSLAETAFEEKDRERALQLVDEFCDDYGTQKTEHDYFFESVCTPWNDGLENMKSQIRNAKEYVSFDVFDTLISRPFYDPTDIFYLMNEEFSLLTNSCVSFEKIRKEGESLARSFYGNKFGYEDISIDEIYDFLSEQYQIHKEITDRMKELERDLELKFCTARHAGRELFEYAKAIGKKVILISDMYLDSEIITKILAKNGIAGYEKLYLSCERRKLKYNGGLFKTALDDLKIESGDVIHIGDTWRSDIEGSACVGIPHIFFPKAREIFENKIQGSVTNHCSDIGMLVCGDYRSKDSILRNLGYRTILGVIINKYFDNPYRTFHAESDFNIDPYFIGYYPVGMHMLGISKWLHTTMTECGYDQLVFLARDGYLPMKAYGEYINQVGSHKTVPVVQYLQASRKAVMPVLLREKINFYQLPVEYRAHTPKSLLKILCFAANEDADHDETVTKYLSSAGIDADQAFTSLEELHAFIDVFFQFFYDKKKHEDAIKKVKEYYSKIADHSLAFDMGYSGRIQSAICEAAGRPVDVAFIHEDYRMSVTTKGHYGFKIHKLYDFVPEISGLMREHIFSDISGSCIGFRRNNGSIEEVFEEENRIYPERHVIRAIQNGAIDFVHDFMNLFGDYMKCMDFSAEDVSLPFEGFLRWPSQQDMRIFSSSFFEDVVWGGREEINIESFAEDNLSRLGWPKAKSVAQSVNTKDSDEERITDLIHHSSQLKRGIIWVILDWSFFTEKLKINIRRFFKKKAK